MGLSANLVLIQKRTTDKKTLQDALIAKTTAEIGSQYDKILEYDAVLLHARQHLDSLTISGETSLADIFYVKKKQGVVKRQIAEVIMCIEEHYKKIEELECVSTNAKKERAALEKKGIKLAVRLNKINSKMNIHKHNQQDSETEEQLNWRGF